MQKVGIIQHTVVNDRPQPVVGGCHWWALKNCKMEAMHSTVQHKYIFISQLKAG